jgi:hypothetical protein
MLHQDTFNPPRQDEPGNPLSFPPRDFHSAMIGVWAKGTAMLAVFTLPGEEKDSGITVKYSNQNDRKQKPTSFYMPPAPSCQLFSIPGSKPARAPRV